jgi:transcriptional regulator with GAF, ATPase, and Fis domain
MPQYSRDDVREPNGRWLPVPTPETLHLVIRGALLNALAFTNGNQAQAARLLGLTKDVMARLMRGHQIPRPRPNNAPTRKAAR